MPRKLRSFVILMAAVFWLPSLVNAAVGYTPGSFKVSETGAATYSIPIAVPPGTAGMQPSLSLAYSSQNGNGLVGMGFSLQGISAITRCPKTYATDGNSGGVDLSYNDRYCLDGQRLILISGTYGYANSEYRTERDTLTRIVAYGVAGNGPSYFIAQTKSGQIIQYGNSTDSRILATGKTTAVVWNVNKITDTVGNYLTVTYTQNTTTGEYYPQRMDYAGNTTQDTATSSSVRFVYAPRTDTFTGYVGGSTITNTQRLTNIQVFEETASIRDYRLTYDSNQASTMTQRSRLTALTECDSNLSSAACLPATTFEWSTDSTGFNTTPLATGITSGSTVWAMDVNGDGKNDLVYYTSGIPNLRIALSSGSGFNTAIDTGISCSSYMCIYAIPTDYNSDGKMDFLVPSGDAMSWYALQSNGTGFVAISTGTFNAGDYLFSSKMMDVNGDGRPDHVSCWDQPYTVKVRWNIGGLTLSNPPTTTSISAYGSPFFNAKHIDYNRDGKADLLVPGPLYANQNADNANWYLLISNGVSGFTIQDTGIANSGYANSPQVMDFNGDGLPDLLQAYDSHWHVSLNNGIGFNTETDTGTDSTNYKYTRAIDYNGDGKMDLLVPSSDGTWHVLQSNGTAFVNLTTGITNTGYSSGAQVADFDGDGLPDMLYYDNGWNIRLHKPGIPDQLTTIANALDAKITITYKPLTDSTVYTKGVPGAFPQQGFQGPMYVVSRYTTSDGIDGNSAVNYSYTRARIDVQGRGFVGFIYITATDTVTGIKTLTNYSQTWPTTGMVISVTKTYNNATISSQTNTLSNYRYGVANAYYYFPYVTQSIATVHELPGGGSNIVSTTTTTNTYHSSCATYDYYCDLTSITVATTAGSNTFTKTTTNTYDPPNTSSWILGRLNNAKVTSALPSGSSLTRESSFTYHPTGLLWTEVVEPNGNIGTVTNLKQTTTYSYDGFGNKTGATVTGADGISRPATAVNSASTAGAPYAYTAGRFETGLTNAVNQGETRVYDARYGTVATLTGPNGLATNWTYDSFGRKSQETRADGTTTTWTYTLCASGCPAYAKYYVTQTTSGAPTVTVYYDLLDREVRTQTQGYDGTAIWKDTVYNSLGQIANVSRPYYSNEVPWWTYFSYDALGRITSQSLPTQANSAGTLLGTTSYSGLTTTVTQYRDGAALNTVQVKDVMGQLVSVTDAAGKITRYEYDPFGNLTKVTDPALNITSMTYDIRGRKLTMTDPDMGYWQYAYNSVGELTRQTDAKGQVVDMTYDALGRLATRSEPEGTTTWVYDNTTISGAKAKGKLSRVTWPGNDSRTYTYDGYGRPSTETTTLSGTAFTLTSTYNLNSRLDTVTYPSGFAVRNNYGAYGYLSSVTNAATGASFWNAPAYNAAGQTTAFTLGNGLTTVNQYDPATGLIKGISTGVSSGSAVQYLTYQYDSLDNLKQRADGNQANGESFNYDNLNRVTLNWVSINGSFNGLKSVSYDALGNITSKSDVGTYTYDPLHKHAVKTAGSGSYTYDANGNQLTGPNGRTLSYTSFNQPISITQGGKTNSFTYDGDHQRQTQTMADGTFMVYINPRIDLGGHYEQEAKPNGTVEYKHYIYAGKENIGVYTTRSVGSPDMRYFHKDHLGSVDTITDETGGIVEQHSYDAWGKRRNGNWTNATTAITSLTHHGFTGHEMLDDVGLIHMNARLYDPTLGRFIQADPTVQSPGNPQTLNRYTYAGNNPLTYVDPSGYGWLSSLWKSIKQWIRPIIAVVAAYFTFGAVYGYFNGLFIWGGSVTAGVLGGAAAGFVAGGIIGGDLRTALSSALGGAITGGVTGAFGRTWSLTRVGATSLAGGVSSEVTGGRFKDGFRFALAVSMTSYAAYQMRQNMIESSKLDARNASGKSAGFRNDGFKLGGGRYDFDDPESISPLGGIQGKEGYLFGKAYLPGSWQDNLVEAYSGPHDFLNSGFWYDKLGNIQQGMSTATRGFGNLVNAANVFLATPIVASSVIPEYTYPALEHLHSDRR